jgi:HK97 family phage major capsid protein
MSKYLTPMQQELRAALVEADEISKRADLTKRDEARLSFLLSKIKNASALGETGTAGAECRQFFRDLLKNREIRTQMEAGSATVTYTAGTEGGYLVPTEFHNQVIHGMAQFDPLLNKDVVTLIESDSFQLRPYQIPGWDLSSFAAVKVAEDAQQNGQTPPTVSSTILNGFKYKASLPVTIELEEDAFQPMMGIMSDAYQIAFARGIGADLVIGNGTTAPQGVLTATTSVLTTANSGEIVLDDIENVYFSVNRYHRAAQKCAWLMNDTAYELVRKSHDTVGNPLLKVKKDKEELMGKPVYISPSLPENVASPATAEKGSFCVFGDLSHIFVRVSKLVIKRQWELPGYVEYGMALYTGIMRADAKVFDPTGGVTPPIVCATLHV